MFRCEQQQCKKMVPPRQPENVIAVETRPQTYSNTIKKGKHKGKLKWTSGREIVREIRVCPTCFTKITGDKALEAKPTPVATRPERKKFEERTFRKKWKNPRRKDKQGSSASPKKKPIVEHVKRLPTK